MSRAWGAQEEDRYVRLMPDFCADGVWDREGVSRFCDRLPISVALVERIRAWQDWYDEAEAEVHAEFVAELLDSFDVDAFQREADAIAEAMRTELPTDWTVVCSDSVALRDALLRLKGR